MSLLFSHSAVDIQSKNMARMYSVFWGLIAASVLDVFVLHVTACDVVRIEKTKTSKSTVNENCPSGYVAVACACSGSCFALYQPSVTRCRAKKVKQATTTLALTCVLDDDNKYYIEESACENPSDTIIACYLEQTTADDYGAETRVITNSDGNAECQRIGNCADCKVVVLCKINGTPPTGGSSK